MSGPEAIPVQRVFVNKKDKKVVNVVWYGHAVSGWPRVVHGGALATILDETMGRVAVFHFPAQTGRASLPPESHPARETTVDLC